MIGSLILMFNTNRSLALTMLPLLLVTSADHRVLQLKMEPLFRTVQQKLDRLNTVLQENIAGVRLVKAFVRADHEGERFEAANEDFTERNVQVMQFMSTMSPVLTIFVNIGMVIVIWAGGLQAIQGDMTVGQIVAFINYLLTTMGPLMMMTMLANIWANGIASAAAHQRSAGYRAGSAGCCPMRSLLPRSRAGRVELRERRLPLQRHQRCGRAG